MFIGSSRGYPQPHFLSGVARQRAVHTSPIVALVREPGSIIAYRGAGRGYRSFVVAKKMDDPKRPASRSPAKVVGWW